jgi:hypothetical protein
MLVTNQTTQDYWFGPLHLAGGVGQTLTVDDTTATSLYLTDDAVADAINNLSNSGKIVCTSTAAPFPRPTGVPQILHGDGAPEGLVYAPQGSLYMRRDGTGVDSLYCKTTGVTINTGWESFGSAVGGAGTEWDYAQITASPAQITATTEGTAVTVITGNSITYDGTRIKVEAYFPAAVGTTSSSKVFVLILRDSTVIGHATTLATTVETGPVLVEVFDTPSAASHIYKVAAYVNAGVTLEAGAGGSGSLLPAFLRVTKA